MMTSALPPSLQPIYMPLWFRLVALVFGAVIAIPPALHVAVHAYLMLHGTTVVEAGSELARLGQIVVGSAVAFPDPIVRLVRGWRRAPETGERRTDGRDRR